VLLVIIVCVMYIFATATARTHIFTAFWTTHQLFYVLYVLILLHGSVRLVQDPYFPYYFAGPAVLFGLDKLVSLSRKKRKLSVLHAELLPSGWNISSFPLSSSAFSALTLLVGRQKGIRPVKKWWGAGVVVCLEQGADLYIAQLMPLPLTASCFSKIQIGFTFLVPADLGSPRGR